MTTTSIGEPYELEVARVVDETADARSFVLRVPPNLREAFHYQAGQFLTFELAIDGRTLRRCYSMSSAPEVDAAIKFTVKRVAEGTASNWFNEQVRAGTLLRVLAPAGRFVLTNSESPILFFAGGSGITPIISLIKSALARTGRRMTLLYANRNRASVVFHSELEEFAARHPDRLTVGYHFDEVAGVLGPKPISVLASSSAEADVYICGPGPFMALVESTLAEAGYDRARIFVERFVSPSLEVDTRGDATCGVACAMTVRFGGMLHQLEARPDETILQAARRAGIDAPSACEQGICGTCLAKLVSGKAAMRSNELLTEAEVAEGLILTCQAVASSVRLEVEY